jgi:acyl-CoA reductase-like NAD-dependent aldehyde dehydrogenase
VDVGVGEPAPIADALIADERVGLLTFTGSADIGWDLKAKAAKKRVTLELGTPPRSSSAPMGIWTPPPR